MDWEDLRVFRALAERGSLERAARDLAVGVATVHRRVARLEDALDVRLFVRRKTGHVLTEAGRLLQQRAESVATALAEARHEIGGEGHHLSGTVRITTTQSAADYILLPAVSELRHSHPQLRIEFEALPEIVDLVDETPSIALRFRRPARGDFTIAKIADLPCSLFADKHLARGMNATRLPDAPHIGWTRQFRSIALSRYVDSFFSQPPILSLGSMNGHLSAAERGIGVAHLPHFLARHGKGLVDLQPHRQTTSLAAWLVVPRSVAHMTRITEASDFVRSAVQSAALPLRQKPRRR